MTTFPVSLDGYTDLPPGKIANVVTFLEMTEPPGSKSPTRGDAAVVTVPRPTAPWYRALYRRIGEDWLWFSRAVMPEPELAAILAKPSTVILTLEQNADTIGLVELDYSVPGEVEIVTFGVVPEAVGTGAGHALMIGALAHAFSSNVRRVWLHTCTFDHPAALGFYLRHGFRAFKFAIEVSDDPRLTGHLPITAAPHVPMLGKRIAGRE